MTTQAEDIAACEPAPAREDAEMVGVVQLLLAEKRTSLAVLRTGMTIALVPLSITTVLVTLSRFYDWLENLQFLVPMYVILTVMMILSFYLMGRAVVKLRRQDRHINAICREHPTLARFVE